MTIRVCPLQLGCRTQTDVLKLRINVHHGVNCAGGEVQYGNGRWERCVISKAGSERLILIEGKRVKEIMNTGALVPDEITIAMLKEELYNNTQAKGFLFDGFPRTFNQAEALDNFMNENCSAIHYVVSLDVTEEEVRSRIAMRR